MLKFFCGSPGFFLRDKFIPKISNIFGDFGGSISPHFKAASVIFGVRLRPLNSLPCQNL